MQRKFLILLVISACLVIAILVLPRTVVSIDDTLQSKEGKAVVADVITPNPHAGVMTVAVRQSIAKLDSLYTSAQEKTTRIFWGDSLTALYQVAMRYDSAALIAEEIISLDSSTSRYNTIGSLFYRSFTLTSSRKQREQAAIKARFFLDKAFEKDPTNYDAKVKSAMTYLSSSNPMQGILMLRQVLEGSPNNRLALFNLGMLSLQSGQYKKAIKRLEKLVEIDATHAKGWLLLGMAYMNENENERAKVAFEEVKRQDASEETYAIANSYLKDLQ